MEAPSPPLAPHAPVAGPSAWVQRWASLVRKGGMVLDVACGGGRHARYFASLGHPVDAVDHDAAAVAALVGVPGINAFCADIEGGPWPYATRSYAAVVVINYLHRPLFPHLLAALAPGGLLIYETFAMGNEVCGRPANPDYLLRTQELIEAVSPDLEVLAYEHLYELQPKPAVRQRICALRKPELDVGQNPFFFFNS